MKNYGNFRIISQGTNGIIFPEVQLIHIKGAPVWVVVAGLVLVLNINVITNCKLELNVNRQELLT